ncbi:MAG: hypothetical protein ACREKE_02345 [bacterium]
MISALNVRFAPLLTLARASVFTLTLSPILGFAAPVPVTTPNGGPNSATPSAQSSPVALAVSPVASVLASPSTRQAALVDGPSALHVGALKVSPTPVPSAVASPQILVSAPALPVDFGPLPAGAPALPGTPGAVSRPRPTPTPGRARVEAPESPFKFKNFLYGFVAGALVGVAYGILSDTSGKNKVQNVEAIVYGLGGGLVFGGISLGLGATTPPPPRPPRQASLPMPGVTLACRF